MNKILIVILGIFMFIGCDIQKEIMATERVAKNRSALEQCGKDQNCLLGGFVVVRANPKIKRISFVARISPCINNCDFGEVSSHGLLRAKNSDWILDQYEEIVLPTDKERWEKLAVKHAERFVKRP